LEVDELVNIFGENLLDKPELLEDFNRLVGVEDAKPFECVGSVSETNTALLQVISQYGRDLPYLLQQYELTEAYQRYKHEFDAKLEEYNKYFDEENALPPNYEQLVRGLV
jgi:hypothetical protein